MDNKVYSEDLQHHGIRGMKWGIRRYQNKDGTLTAEGRRRYNQELEKLNAKEAKIKAAEEVAANKKKTKAKIDALDAKKAELEAREKALKKGAPKEAPPEKPAETPEQKKERLLKSSDPKELYENRDMFTYQELSDRINRIDLEAKLQGKIPPEPTQPSATERMNNAKKAIDKSVDLYKSIDTGFSTLANSYIGKTLAEALGIELPKNVAKAFDLDDFYKNMNKKSHNEVENVKKRLENENAIEKEYNRRNKQK